MTVFGAAAVAAALAMPGSAAFGANGQSTEPVAVVASGLNGPYGLSSGGGPRYVAEGDIGQITRIDARTGATTPVVTGLEFPSGVDKVGHKLAIVTGGGSEVPIEGDASVFLAEPGGAPVLLADLEAYELEFNPDGQQQFSDTGEPLDALSNPFALLTQRGGQGVLVADGGANAVLSVSLTGEVSTFFVPPLVTTGACAGAENNDPDHVGCDSVPTGLAYGPGNTLYVSTYSGGLPGEGRVYVLDARTAAVRQVITGFDGPTGIAVAPDGTVYVSEVFFGAPEGEGPPPPDFDPGSIGRIVRVAPGGTRTYAQVTMPTGLMFHGNTLHASAWSTASFLGIQGAGQVVRVSESAFS